MGGLLHLFDFNQGGSMARKIYMHKQEVDGLEAPRNSLELPAETSQSYHAVGDSVPYSYQVKEEWSENRYSTKSSMKKLIKEETSKRPNTRHSAPSIVARLMGIDTMPFDTKSIVQKHEKRKKELNERGSVVHVPRNSTFSRQMDDQRKREKDHGQRHETRNSAKLRPREHPQEEELQKFKKDFEAWQVARLKECSRVLEVGSMPRHLLAEEKLKKEKLTLANSRKTQSKNTVISSGHVKSCSYVRDGSQHRGYKKNLLEVDQSRESFPVRSRTMSMDFEQHPLLNSDRKVDISSAPTRIVILKPGPDGIGNYEEPSVRSSGISEERGSLEDFLEEVKGRLKYEMRGKTLRRGTVSRGGAIDPTVSEEPSDPKQIARNIAQQVRESVTRDLGMNLLRSESTRSYRSEIQLDEPGSPEFINRDSRRFLSERLRNVLSKEAYLDFPTAVGRSSRVSMHEDDRCRLEHTGHISKTIPEMKTGSFRRGSDDGGLLHREFSPRSLVRSLSAPVSGTSFGKLLLEDRHILTGAHIRRKQEASENVAVDERKQKRERFNLREKVSSLKHNFSLRGRLFGRRVQSAVETRSSEHDFINDLMSGPTVVLSFCDRHENSTEVPPSPASVCSTAHEELWGSADHLSPISTPDLSAVEDQSLPQVFREINSNLNELRRQLNELESDGSCETEAREEPLEVEVIELEDWAKTYVRDLLVASGLYNRSSDRTLSRWDPLAKPIGNHVFEEVEESYRKLTKDSERYAYAHNEEQVDHRLLLDLLNEALSAVLGPPVGKVFSYPVLPPPCGRRLLDHVWEIMREHVYPSENRSSYLLDSLVAQDMGSNPWPASSSDEVGAMGREMERLIIGDLIEETVKDMDL